MEYKYKILNINTETPENNIIIQNFLFSLNFNWSGAKILFLATKPIVIQVNLQRLILTQCPDYNQFKSWYDHLKNEDSYILQSKLFHDSKIYTIRDLKIIENIVKYGSDIPNYEPRKLIKNID